LDDRVTPAASTGSTTPRSTTNPRRITTTSATTPSSTSSARVRASTAGRPPHRRPAPNLLLDDSDHSALGGVEGENAGGFSLNQVILERSQAAAAETSGQVAAGRKTDDEIKNEELQRRREAAGLMQAPTDLFQHNVHDIVDATTGRPVAHKPPAPTTTTPKKKKYSSLTDEQESIKAQERASRVVLYQTVLKDSSDKSLFDSDDEINNTATNNNTDHNSPPANQQEGMEPMSDFMGKEQRLNLMDLVERRSHAVDPQTTSTVAAAVASSRPSAASANIEYDAQGRPKKTQTAAPSGGQRPGAYLGAPGTGYDRQRSTRFRQVNNSLVLTASSHQSNMVDLLNNDDYNINNNTTPTTATTIASHSAVAVPREDRALQVLQQHDQTILQESMEKGQTGGATTTAPPSPATGRATPDAAVDEEQGLTTTAPGNHDEDGDNSDDSSNDHMDDDEYIQTSCRVINPDANHNAAEESAGNHNHELLERRDSLSVMVHKNKALCRLGGLLVGFLAIVAIVITVVMVVTRGGGADGDSPNNNDNGMAGTGAEAAEDTAMTGADGEGGVNISKTLLPNVDDATWDAIVNNVSSPQHQAYTWLTEEDVYMETYDVWRREQRFALATFYYAFDGPSWRETDMQARDWLKYQLDECAWMSSYEPNSCHKDGRVKMLNVTELPGFQGSVPPELALLTKLETLDLSNNYLETTLDALLPLGVGAADADGTTTAKPMPPSFHTFLCRYCGLQGTIPAALGSVWSGLQTVHLNNNEMEGALPSEMGEWSNLRDWRVASNKLTGPIPTEIASASNLETLMLGFNTLASFPPALGSLTKLQVLDLDNNVIDMAIPTEIGRLTNLLQLNLANMNRADSSGGASYAKSLPSEMGLLANLTHLFLQEISLTGTLPLELSQLTKLEHLVLIQNALKGPISAIGNMTSMKILHLSSNNFNSTIPSEIGALSQLEEVLLQKNDFSGILPSEIAELPLLKTLHVYQNPKIVPELPPGLCRPDLNLKTSWCDSQAECCSR